MINVGQIYSYKKIGNFVITNITEEKISRIWQDGSVDEIDINVYDGRMFGVLIAEFGSWQEAVCSNDFKEINGDQYEKIKELEKRLENLTNNYKLLEKSRRLILPTAKLWLMNLAILRVFMKNCNGCERKASRCLTFWKWSQEGLRLIVTPKTLFG